MLARLVAAIDSGRLVLVRVDPPRQWGYSAARRAERPENDDDDRPLEPSVDATHWIEIRLVDDEDAVIPGQRYLVTDPGGHQHRGYTDSLGSARITRLPPGVCRVSFPDLDGSVCELMASPGPRDAAAPE
ncbi:carboxypeptidase-like regulatory domain-containing protein [Nannocystis pusilla]|uniref:Carboxypeptidase-like regulatory domain-containing protein n=1 Tax=Nannocystis pusilla TaxID=889268 RepID=A0ABS7TLZ9_9BACT|nr:carboxypeptidase-like regulatory domain-containing protein [Nannocystis pusilla]MBZ5709257.1 carboxypeptidase-like regulatory domain-containing protein [Nannocystis pusilla]